MISAHADAIDSVLDFQGCDGILRAPAFNDGAISRMLEREEFSPARFKLLDAFRGAQGARLFLSRNGHTRLVMKAGEAAKRERAAFVVSHRLGFGFVPQTELFSREGKLFSAQKFVQGEDIASVSAPPNALFLFDALLQNGDRGLRGHNYLVVRDPATGVDRFVAIDHAMMGCCSNPIYWQRIYRLRLQPRFTVLEAASDHPEVIRNLRLWDERMIRKDLAGVIDDSDIDQIVQSREWILGQLRE